MTPAHRFPATTAAAGSHQRGAVLAISLIMLLLLTLIGVTAMQVTTMEERMAGNMLDVNRAFQASEAALRDGEEYLAPFTAEPSTCTTAPCALWAKQAITEGTIPVDPSTKDAAWWAANAQEFGEDGTQDIEGLAEDPRYVVEYHSLVKDSKTLGFGPPTGRVYYRVTARGVGGQETTETILQSTYVKRFN